ncbi:Putative phage-related protein (fragment) [Cupriavidus taiwanensis]|uniref:Phage-related protein n=1 Tax=Cupriavidus taiwanensis TaxID=164546 RepID=A0A375DVM1_9BURK
MPVAQEIAELEARRADRLEAAEGLHERATREARDLNAFEKTAFESLTSEIEGIDTEIAGLRRQQTLSATSATSIHLPGTPTSQNPTARGIGAVKSNAQPGTTFARYAMALAAGKGNLHQSLEYAKAAFGKSSPEIVTIIKAAVAAGTTTDPTWAAPLVEYRDMASEFIELLRPATIVGRLDGFRRVPFNIRVPRQTAGASVGWVGEGKPKPVSKLGFDAITLPFAKVAGIVAITEELARFSSPSAEALVRDDLVETIGTFLDVQFIDPAVVANPAANSPASITNGAHSASSTGSAFAAIDADLTGMIGYMAAQGILLSGLAWVMNTRTKIHLENLRNVNEELAYPSVSASGTLKGFPIVDSASVPITEGVDPAPDTTFIALIAPREVLLADDGSVTLDASREASLQMSDDGTGSLVSLWQQNLVGIRAERYIYWQPRRAQCVTVLTGVTY